MVVLVGTKSAHRRQNNKIEERYSYLEQLLKRRVEEAGGR